MPLSPDAVGPSYQVIATGAVGVVVMLLQVLGNRHARDTRDAVQEVKQDVQSLRQEMKVSAKEQAACNAAHEKLLTEHETTLFGAKGDNGLNGELRSMRTRLHDLAAYINQQFGKSFRFAEDDKR